MLLRGSGSSRRSGGGGGGRSCGGCGACRSGAGGARSEQNWVNPCTVPRRIEALMHLDLTTQVAHGWIMVLLDYNRITILRLLALAHALCRCHRWRERLRLSSVEKNCGKSFAALLLCCISLAVD